MHTLDGTGLRTEFDIGRNWRKIGVPPALESNNSNEGLNIIGATEIKKTLIPAWVLIQLNTQLNQMR